MPQSFQTISHKNIAKGMDTRSSLNSIREGYAELARNMNTNSSGFVETRKGYQGYLGDLPLRVRDIEVGQTQLILSFDNTYDFTGIEPKPLVGYGAFGSDAPLEMYWEDFINPIFTTPVIGDNTEDNASGTTDNLIGVSQQLTPTTSSHTLTNGSKFNDTTITHNIGSSGTDLAYFTADLSTSAGSYFVEFDNSDADINNILPIAEGSSSYWTFPPSFHNLENMNMIPQVFEKIAGDWVPIEPNEFEITELGEIKVTIDNQEFGNNYYKLCVFDVDGMHSTRNLSTSHTFTNVKSAFNFVSVFGRDATSVLKMIPDEVIYNAATKELTISIDNTSGLIDVVWSYHEGVNPSNILIVDRPAGWPAGWTTSSDIEFVIYGISQGEILGNTGGTANVLKEYSTVGITDLVVAMNGNFYTDKAGILTSPITTIDISSRTSSYQTLTPFFGTRGIQSCEAEDGQVVIEEIRNLRNGTFEVHLDLGEISSGDFSLLKERDQLTISQTGNPLYNGTFEIIDYNNNALTLQHSNLGPAVPSEVNVDGIATINSDSILMVDASVYKVGDKIESSIFTAAPTVVAVDGNYIYIDGITSDIKIAGGSKFNVTRTTDQLPLSNSDYFLEGDMIEVENYTRLFTVLAVDVLTKTITIDEAIEVSSAELKSNYVTTQGRWIPIEAPELNDPIMTHLDESPINEQTRLRAAAVSDSLFLSNYNDEVLKYDGDNIYQAGLVPWNPYSHSWLDDTEAGISVKSYSYIASSETEEGFIKLQFASSNTLPPYADEIYLEKNDSIGPYLIDGGIYSVTNHNTADNTITISGKYASEWSSDYEGIDITIQANDSTSIAADFPTDLPSWPVVRSIIEVHFDGGGTNNGEFRVAGISNINGNSYRITLTNLDGTDPSFFAGPQQSPEGYIRYKSNGGSGKCSLYQEFGYYFKLQMIDRNGNFTTSAITNPADSRVKIAKSGKIYHRLFGLPKFGNYDYDRVDLMVYRTKADTVAPFFEVRRYPIDYESALTSGYIIVRDGLGDLSLDSDDDISVNLKGGEYPLSTREPARAKYMSSVNSRLVQGNIRGYPELDITLRSSSGIEIQNVLGWETSIDRTVIDISSGDNSQAFEYIPITNTDVTKSGNLQNVAYINQVAGETTAKVSLLGGSVDVGQWIQLSSFLTNRDDTDFYTTRGTGGVASLGRFLGWHKVVALDSGDPVINVPYSSDGININSRQLIGGVIVDPIYALLPDFQSSSVPIMSLPYADTFEDDDLVVTKLLYNDGISTLDLTSAVIRGGVDFRKAFNTYMTTEQVPWAYVNSGSTYGAGRFLIRSTSPSDELKVTVTYDTDADLQVFSNNIGLDSGVEVLAQTPTFPSRLLKSNQLFPEMMDNPYAFSAVDSDSIIDISADDGQEIAGMSQFFAIGSTSAAQVENTLIVFKEYSIYNVDIQTGAVSKIESQGQGCTIPDSISATTDGIMFANESGMYVVTPNLRVLYIGEAVEGLWKELGQTDLSNAVGFLDSSNRKYKLSVPPSGQLQNSEVIVYDYIRSEGDGSWTVYDNTPASAWAQRGTDIMFGTYKGRVYKIRDVGDATDQRDDASPITSVFTYAPQSFGDSATRKDIGRIETHFSADTPCTDIEVSTSVDMNKEFKTLDGISFTGIDKNLYTIGSSVDDKHCTFLQVKYTHSTKDEKLKISGIDFKVKALEELGINQTE